MSVGVGSGGDGGGAQNYNICHNLRKQETVNGVNGGNNDRLNSLITILVLGRVLEGINGVVQVKVDLDGVVKVC